MTFKGCGAWLLVFVAALAAFLVWWNFFIAYEREREKSPDGNWVATAYIDGTPLSRENEKVHLWRAWQPRFRWLGCEVLEAKNESTIRLTWKGATTLVVEHGFSPSDLLHVDQRCGDLTIVIRRSMRPYR